MKESKIETWIRAGYKLLGSEGVNGIKVERLARTLRLNKSGFYHYFGSMRGYLKSVLDHHVQLSKGIAEEIRNCKEIDPDLLRLIVRHKSFFLVESQLLVKGKRPHANGLDEASNIISKEFLPLWKRATNLPGDSSVALAYLNILRHFFYARINSDNVNYEFMHTLVSETRDVLNTIVKEKNVLSQKAPIQ